MNWILASITAISVLISVFYFYSALKHKTLWRMALNQLATERLKYENEVQYRSLIIENKEKSDEIIERLTRGTVPRDVLDDIRSGVLP